MKPDLSKLKYRIGDKVLYQGKPTEIIAYSISGNTDYTIRWHSPYAHRGNIFSVDEFGNPLVFDDCSAFYVLEEELTLIENNTMTINDLNNFDILTLRNGRQVFVYNDLFISIKDDSYIVFKSSYNANLLNDNYTERDIMKVERMNDETYVRDMNRFMYNYLQRSADIIYKTVYERVETTELTMQQIADKFGVPVEQLKIKK